MHLFSADFRNGVLGYVFGLVFFASAAHAVSLDDQVVVAERVPPFIAQAFADDDANDPLEEMNRVVFDFNEQAYAIILRPVAEVYKERVPETVRDGIGNALHNLSTPVTVANNLLQGDIREALGNFAKFVVNTFLGFGGMSDVAGDMGDPVRRKDFGQTLAVWGLHEGFYLVLPVLGPSNPRDAVGIVVDQFLDPVAIYAYNDTDLNAYTYATMSATAVDEYAGVVDELDQIKRTSVDYYAAIRSMYRQRRAAQINNGSAIDLPPIPDVSLDFDNFSDDAGQADPR